MNDLELMKKICEERIEENEKLKEEVANLQYENALAKRIIFELDEQLLQLQKTIQEQTDIIGIILHEQREVEFCKLSFFRKFFNRKSLPDYL